MIATILGTMIRVGLSGFVLYIVWHHSHWSVALVLSLLALNAELSSWILRAHGIQIRRKQ